MRPHTCESKLECFFNANFSKTASYNCALASVTDTSFGGTVASHSVVDIKVVHLETHQKPQVPVDSQRILPESDDPVPTPQVSLARQIGAVGIEDVTENRQTIRN